MFLREKRCHRVQLYSVVRLYILIFVHPKFNTNAIDLISGLQLGPFDFEHTADLTMAINLLCSLH